MTPSEASSTPGAPRDSAPATSASSESPLHGLRVVVTRPRPQAEALGRALRAQGAEVVYLPVIEIADPDTWDELDLALRKLAEGLYSWVLFSSANSVAKTFERLFAVGLDARAFGRTKIAAVGPVSARVLRAHGLIADLVPEDRTAVAAAQTMGRGVGRVLLPRAQDAPADVLEALEAAGWIPEVVVAYRTVAAELRGPEIEAVRAGVFDALVFMSGSAARAFAELVAAPEALGLGPDQTPGRLVVCIGPRTTDHAAETGFRIDVVAREHTAAGVVDGLIEHLGAPSA
jgi:uroporphyrinogen-III synthase